MSKELMSLAIANMTIRLNKLIISKNYDLLNHDVLVYSKRLDKAITHYNNSTKAGSGPNQIVKDPKKKGLKQCSYDFKPWYIL